MISNSLRVFFSTRRKKIFEFSYTLNQNSESTIWNEYKSEYGQSYELWIMLFANVDVIQICNHGTLARDGGHQHIWIIWLLHFISLQTQRCRSSKSFKKIISSSVPRKYIMSGYNFFTFFSRNVQFTYWMSRFKSKKARKKSFSTIEWPDVVISNEI